MASRINFSQVEAFERKLQNASRIAEQEADQFEEHWGERLVDELKDNVPVGDTAPHLRDQIEQVEPGGITFGGPEFDYWRFPEYGTAFMAPQPFVRPSLKAIRTPAQKDAGERAINWIRRGR